MKDKMFVIDEKYAKHVHEADALYIERQSAGAIVVEFRKGGYRTPRGTCYNNPMICRMLRNPTYVAKLEYEGHVYTAQWQPIRDMKTHQVIQQLMDRNALRNGTPNKPTREYEYLLQGLIRCRIREIVSPPLALRPGRHRSGR